MSQEEMFNMFWKAYPKKTAKPKAKKAFEKLKADESTLNNIIKAVEKSKKTYNWIKENGQYIPYPATYLNQRRWEDETDGETEQSDAGEPKSYGIVL
ncbi:MAG: hypothetical protein Q4F95_00770 [Oscillospiraceae bacterium]|nr:hypothetical protein [Oscillospiraceae bacterium]